MKRILYIGDASYLHTGYGVYAREVLKRLHAAGRYELAELACYDDGANPRGANRPWKVYPNLPRHESEWPLYNKSSLNQFGPFRFHDVCLDFRPDCVFAIRDPWVDEFIQRSPFRAFYRFAWMPTVDSVPYQEQWLATAIDADAVWAYTDWGADVLRGQGGGLINVLGSAPPGADLEVFRPMDRAEARRRLHVDEDDFIVGFVNRNQSRKLIPNLIKDFGKFLAIAPPQIARKSYLYLHTSFPDRGWDIPKLIKTSGIAHRILFTYKCTGCAAVFPSLYADSPAICPSCREKRARLSSVKFGVEREVLALIYNLFDVYVQYTSNEGFGVGLVEAASCGVPVMATDYSAMEDVVRKLNGTPIRPLCYPMDSDLGTYKAIPDPGDFAVKLAGLATMDPAARAQARRNARQGVEEHYDWDVTAAKWMAVFDELPPALPWDSPSREVSPCPPPGDFPSHEALVRWAIAHYLGRPELAHTYMAVRMIRDLNWGVKVDSVGGYHNEMSAPGSRMNLKDFGLKELLADLDAMRAEFNHWERRRCGHR